MDSPVEVKIGGFSYRVNGSASEVELHRLAGLVDQRLRALGGSSRNPSPHSLVLVAMTLAHELEEERISRQRAEERSKEMLRSLLQRIDSALEADASAAEQDDGSGQFDPVSPDL
jgi:cell division protein ZapA